MKSLKTRVPLVDEVAEIIRQAILDGTIRPGEKIVQTELARHLGISRGPVREALRLLIGEGLIDEKPRQGTYAVHPTVQDVRELYDIRIALEVRAAQLVLAGDSSLAVHALQYALARLDDAFRDHDSRGTASADFEFHEALSQASGNRRLHLLYLQQSTPIRQLLMIDDASYEALSSLIEDHAAILEALKRGQTHDLLDLLVSHLEQARDRLTELVQDRSSSRFNDETIPLPRLAGHRHGVRITDPGGNED